MEEEKLEHSSEATVGVKCGERSSLGRRTDDRSITTSNLAQFLDRLVPPEHPRGGVMMYEDSPWGSEELPPPIHRPASPSLPSFSPPTLSTTNDDWGQDGGWGGATDDFSSGFGTSSGSVEVEVTTENVELEQQPSSSPQGFGSGGGWGRSDSPELPPISSTNSTTNIEAPQIRREQSPTLPEPEGFARSPNLSVASQSPILSPSLQDVPQAGELNVNPKADDWGVHGADVELPPIQSLKVDVEPSAAGGGG
ncbi:hypothetical protein P7C70_g5391, partial [Phenoliferia sp. Uapishka_3]